MNIEELRESVGGGRYELRIHVVKRMIEKGVSLEMITGVILEGEVIEDYPTDKPFPSCLMLKVFESRPIHVVVALDEKEGKAYFITTYEPDLEHFETDFKTRRKK